MPPYAKSPPYMQLKGEKWKKWWQLNFATKIAPWARFGKWLKSKHSNHYIEMPRGTVTPQYTAYLHHWTIGKHFMLLHDSEIQTGLYIFNFLLREREEYSISDEHEEYFRFIVNVRQMWGNIRKIADERKDHFRWMRNISDAQKIYTPLNTEVII